MLAMPSGTLACPNADRRHRLVAQLTDMIPGAAIIRVSLNDPKQRRPHLHAVVEDEAGKTIEVSRTTARVAARWILRVWPEADWARSHTVRLADATLTSSDLTVAGRGR
ncbi:transcriptional regulator [Streptomyces sp. NPDC094447]|uniref:transcriptional regulator n=1 Tax=Streptomyces sp. NPDC094447 TaxID=3366062 RepID=UPI003809D703